MRVWIALLAVVAACDSAREQAAHAASAPSTVITGVEFAGCSVVDRGARCELGTDRRLTFWLPNPHVLAAVRGDGGELPLPAAAPADEGCRYQLHVPAGVKKLELSTGAGARFALTLVEPLAAPELERAQLLREQGKFDEARTLLRRLLPRPSALERRARAQLARIALAEGDDAAAAEGLQASMRAAFESGRISEAIYDATALAFVLTAHVRNYSHAREVLEHAAKFSALDPAGAALLPHYEGMLARETGDLRTALAAFRLSARRAGRLGLREHELVVREQEAGTLVLLGRYDEAVATQERVVEAFPSADPCLRSDRSEAVVWFGLMAEPARGSRLASVVERYAARAARELESCPAPWRRRNHQINALLFALQQGDRARAEVLLEELAKPSALRDPVLDTWERELRGRHALLVGRAGPALEHFRAALDQSERAGLWDNRQLAQLGVARAYVQLQQPKAALAAFEAAERSLDSSLASVPFSEGQAGFRRAREAGTEEWIRLLLQAGATARAFEVARSVRAKRSAALAAAERARSLPPDARKRWEAALTRYQERRALAEKMAGEAWQLPADQLSEHKRKLERRRQEAHEALDEAYAVLRGASEAARPADQQLTAAGSGEAVLGLFPDRDRLLVFLQLGDRTRSRELPLFDLASVPPDLGDALLRADASLLVDRGRLRVIAHPTLGWLDLHGVQYGGARLLERFSVRYGTDSPASPRDGAQTDTLIVIDPRGDLRAAEAEEKLVAPARTNNVHTLYGREASRAALLAQLPRTGLFHYAGHHRFAGIEGTDSAFSLADGELSVGDVLTLPRGPARVVLATCEGAKYEGPGMSGGLGMAQAFIAIGASEVIAATRPVPDAEARELTAALYEAMRADPRIDLTEALRRAQLQLAERTPEPDWRAFRAIGR